MSSVSICMNKGHQLTNNWLQTSMDGQEKDLRPNKQTNENDWNGPNQLNPKSKTCWKFQNTSESQNGGTDISKSNYFYLHSNLQNIRCYQR